MKRSILQVLAFFFLAFVLAACSSPSSITQAPAPQTVGNTQEVKIASFAFDPPTLTVPVGTTVKWTNQDSTNHTVTADDQSFDSGALAQGKSFSFTFQKEGTYIYKCTIHPDMVAKITVTK